MNQEKLVSVAVPNYNSDKYLQRSLDSIINQTYKNIEIICVDDFSNDNSIEIIRTYQRKDNRIKLFQNQKNLGAGITKNACLKEATGDYLLIVDADDKIEPNSIETLLKEALKIDADYVGANHIKVWEKRNHYKYHKSKNFIQNYFQSLSSCNKLYKREFLVKNNIEYLNTRSCVDMPFVIKIFVLAQKFTWLNFDFYYYFQNEGSVTKPISKEQDDLIYLDVIKAFEEIDSFLKNKNINDKRLNKILIKLKLVYLKMHFIRRHYSNKSTFVNAMNKYLMNDKKLYKKFYAQINNRLRKYIFLNAITIGKVNSIKSKKDKLVAEKQSLLV